MAVGAALARGIQLGSMRRPESDLSSVIPLAAKAPQGVSRRRTRRTPAQIRAHAADQMLAEKNIQIMERQQDLDERKQNLQEQAYRDTQRQELYKRREGILTEAQKATREAEGRVATAEGQVLKSSLAVSEQGEADRRRAQRNDYALAKVGLGSKNPQSIIQYFDNWGDKNTRIQDIQFAPDGRIIVQFEGTDQPAIFENSEQAFKMLLAPTNPDYEGAIKQAKEEREERKVVAKEKEVDIKAGKGGLTEKNKADLREKYNKQFSDMVKMGAEEKDRDTWVDKRMKAHEAPKAAGITKPGKPAPRKAKAREPRIFRNRKTGEMMKLYPDGRQEKITPGGEGKITYTEEKGVVKGKIDKGRGAVHKQKMPKEEKPGEKATGIVKPQLQKQQTVSYKDKKGNTVTVTIDSKGEMSKKVTPPQKKKKRKKKKKR